MVNGKIPVIMNIAEKSTRNAITAAGNAKKYGADGLMVLPPMQYTSIDYETVAYLKAVAKSSNLPIMIYNSLIDYKIEATLNMFNELLNLDNIQEVKDSSKDISNVSRIRNHFGDRLNILCGVDTLALDSY